jgi:hypothetical protein
MVILWEFLQDLAMTPILYDKHYNEYEPWNMTLHAWNSFNHFHFSNKLSISLTQ